MTAWSDARLHQLFERYRLRYWPRSRRLKQFRIENRSLVDERAVGMCEFDTRVLAIDVAAHTSDREVRATVLHEMIHAVVDKGGHGAPFWTQLEYLLSRHAPVTIGFPELGERGTLLQVIPRRFRLCRRLFLGVHFRHQRQLTRIKAIRSTELLTVLAQEAEDATIEGATWTAYWQRSGEALGVVNLDGRTLPSGEHFRKAVRRGWQRGRREYLRSHGRS